MRKFLKILATVMTIAGTIVLLGFADSEHHNLQCQAVDITILNPGDGVLITVEEIMSLLTGDSRPLTGRRIESLDLYRMERALTENPYIATAEVYATIDGLLVVQVSLRHPIIRVINSKDQQGFIDREGVLGSADR